jgi:hypothetical protein
MTRVPYADRPEVIAEFCTCDEDNPDPACPLHGENREEAPY